jgi:phasin
MAKPKTVETIEFPAFDATKMTDQLRSFAEKGAEDAQKALETSFETVKAAGAEVSLAMIAAMRTNAEASFSHFEKMVGASSVAEMIELQTAFVRQQAEKFASQAKDMQDVATKAVERVSEPVKTAFDKAMNEVKAAA